MREEREDEEAASSYWRQRIHPGVVIVPHGVATALNTVYTKDTEQRDSGMNWSNYLLCRSCKWHIRLNQRILIWWDESFALMLCCNSALTPLCSNKNAHFPRLYKKGEAGHRNEICVYLLILTWTLLTFLTLAIIMLIHLDIVVKQNKFFL